jgi:hypothetical protein
MSESMCPHANADATLRGQLQSEVIRTMSCCARVLLEIERQCQNQMRQLLDIVQRHPKEESEALLARCFDWAKTNGLSTRDGAPHWLISCIVYSVPAWRVQETGLPVRWARAGTVPYFRLAVAAGFLNALITSHAIYETIGPPLTPEDFNEPFYYYTTAYDVIIPSSRKTLSIKAIGSGWDYHVILDGLAFDYVPEWQRRPDALADIMRELKLIVEKKLIEIEKKIVARNAAETAITGRRTFNLRSVRSGHRDRFDWLVKQVVLKQSYTQIHAGVRTLTEASLRQQISNARREVQLGQPRNASRK